jgi:hypothetical protein
MDKDDQQQPADDSLRATLDAAFAEKATSDNQDQPASQGDDASKQQPVPKAPAAAPAADQQKPEPKQAASPIEAPARWTKEEKEQWDKMTEGLDPAQVESVRKIQSILVNRNRGMEGAFTKQMQEIAADRAWRRGFEDVLAPYRSVWQKAGIDDTAAVKQLLDGFDHSNRDPIGFIRWIAQQRGVDPRQLVSAIYPQALQQQQPAPTQQSGQAPDQTVQLHPEVKRRLDEQAQTIQRLQQQLGGGLNDVQMRIRAQEMAEQQAVAQQASSSVQQFMDAVDDAGNLKYPFAADVRNEMGALIKTGAASTLEEAYDKAVYANPQTRQKIIETRDIQMRRDFEARLREDAKKAKQAAGGLSQGAPVLTGEPARGDGPVGSVRAELEAALAARIAGSSRRI